MLRLDRVGAEIEVPLALSPEDVGLTEPAQAEALRASQAAYEGVRVVVRLLPRLRAMALADEARRLYLAATGDASAEEAITHAQLCRAAWIRHVTESVVALPGAVIGGVDLGDRTLGSEAIAAALDEAHMPGLLADVAARARNAQAPSRAAKNASASSLPPSGDGSSISGA